MAVKQLSDLFDRLALPLLRYIYPAWFKLQPPLEVPGWMHWVYGAAAVVVVLLFISVTAMILIWLERKVSGLIQRRMGPMTTGPQWKWYKQFLLRGGWISVWFGGLLQTFMDTVKLIIKEDTIPLKADRLLFITAPFVIMMACFMNFLVIPFGPGLIVRDLNIGLLYFIAVSSITVIAILMAGWSSNNKYSLLGGLRSAAQIISYEVPMVFSLLSVVLLAGSLRMGAIVEAQQKAPGWFIFPLFIGFVVYFIASIAETNRPPFDLPEAESELVAGFSIEYSGIRFSMFYLAEFTNMFVVAAIAATVFLGGWTLPFGLDLGALIQAARLPHPGIITTIAGTAIFFAKTYFLIFMIMWTRWTFPRLRGDHLMGFGWKVLLPFSFLNLVIACLWAWKIM